MEWIPPGFSWFFGLTASAEPRELFGLAHDLDIAAFRQAGAAAGGGSGKRPSRANRMVCARSGSSQSCRAAQPR